MKPALIVAICVSFAITSVPASAQQGSVTERVYSSNGFAPSRTVERRTESGGREIVVLTEELPGPDGRWIAVEEIATETAREGDGTVRTRQDVFGFDGDRRRTLRQTTESTASPSVNGLA